MSGQDDVADIVPPAPPRAPFWADERLRGYVVQAVALALVVGFFGWMAWNAAAALHKTGQATGFSFLWTTAGFDIGFHLIDYSRASTHFDVLVVGLLNTLLISALGILLATILGFIVGIARLSPNWIVAKLAAAYIEIVRNVPLLLWILFFYLALIPTLPSAKQAISLGQALENLVNSAIGVLNWLLSWITGAADTIGFLIFGDGAFLSNRGLYIPKLHWTENAWIVLIALIAAVVAAVAIHRYAVRRQLATGYRLPDGLIALGLLVGLPLLALFGTGWPVSLEFPELKGFNFRGGLAIQPELVALLFALTIYTATYIAEIVRSGIEGVSKGQSEAASALGLSRVQRLRLVVIPQAMRIIIPPLTSQYLSLTKNSSLATAIAYPDLVAAFAGTSLNQTGQAIEILAITAGIYLALSLLTSLVMNVYNARIQLRER
ncbi:MAG: ABC transporter permease subunit [Alphaproteobacteria bacterium]|nr:ABC transporter permease subunit [Alphaproteobacteria bacterium]